MANTWIMEVDFYGETAYIGNCQRGMEIIQRSTGSRRFVYGELQCFTCFLHYSVSAGKMQTNK